jgi:hypothetical protein
MTETRKGTAGLFVAGLLELLVFFPEALDAPRRVDELLLAREKRVALGTDFHGNVLPGGSGGERRAAVARDLGFPVGGVDTVFHGCKRPPTEKLGVHGSKELGIILRSLHFIK